MYDDEIDGFYETFRDLLSRNTPQDALEQLARLRLTPDEIESIRERHHREALSIREMREPRSVVVDGLETWYTGPSEKDPCWPALAERLEKRGITGRPFAAVDGASSKVVSLLQHPRVSRFATRGLVVGYVQSNKTTNRILGTDLTRHVFARMWWRAHLVCDREVPTGDPYQALSVLGEAGIDQILARRRLLGQSPYLFRAVLRVWSTVDRGELSERLLLQDFLKRLLRLFPFLCFEALSEEQLESQLHAVVAEAQKALTDAR